MSETMLERMARATYERWTEDVQDLEPFWCELPESHRARLIDASRAALEAIKEPSETIEDQLAEGIIQAGEQVPCGLADGWRLSIQAILDGK